MLPMQMWVPAEDRVHGRVRRGDRDGDWLDVSLARVDSIPADVPQAFLQ
jgi:hypothetical protein